MTGAFVAAALLMTAGSAFASTCLRLRDIQDASSKDGKNLVVTMRDGTVYNNRLQGVCSQLKFEGFVWVAHNDEVCDRENTIRVLNGGQVCQLGVFTPVPKKTVMPPAPH